MNTLESSLPSVTDFASDAEYQRWWQQKLSKHGMTGYGWLINLQSGSAVRLAKSQAETPKLSKSSL